MLGNKNSLMILLAFLIIILSVLFLSYNSSDQIVSQELYDSLYLKEPTWSINQFPVHGTNYNGSTYAWGWSYVADSLVNMYQTTGDEKYLERFIEQAVYIFSQADEELGIESFTGSGLSLPAWSDKGHYTSGEFNYIYPVHTGMITLPILRFIDVVYTNQLNEFKTEADKFLSASGVALAIHNQDNMWIDFSDTEGFYMGHSYGEGIVSEAGKIGVPNRISIYIAACGLYDKLNGSNIYSNRIEKSLNYIKYSLLKYDEVFDSYYWSYWEEQTMAKPWEDISHAALTVYGIFILHEEAEFTVFTDEDFKKFANNVYKIINDKGSTIKMRKYIHKRDEEEKTYYNMDENPYYYDVLRWSFLGTYDENILDELENVYSEVNMKEMLPQTRLTSIASFLYTKEKTNGIDLW